LEEVEMKSKIVGIFVCMLLITTIVPITVLAGDPENPELKDGVGDVLGTWPQQSLKKIDMEAAWFYEDSSNQDYLYISLKIVDLDATIKTETASLFTDFLTRTTARNPQTLVCGMNRMKEQTKTSTGILFPGLKKTMSFMAWMGGLMNQLLFKRVSQPGTDSYQAVFAVCWAISTSNNYYSTLVHNNPDGSIYFWVGKSVDNNDYNWYYIDGTFDKENNIITWIIPKDKIDNPQQGTELIDISAHTHLRKISNSGEGPDLAKDLARSVKHYIIRF